MSNIGREKIKQQYSGVELGHANYREGKKIFADEFAKEKDLHYLLGEIYSGDSELTSDGLNFLKEYYGLDSLAALIEKMGGLDSDCKSAQSVLDWLKSLESQD